MKKHLFHAVLLLSLYLGLHNGYIALWNTEHPQPEHVFPYRVALYPKIDQNALAQGIPVLNGEHLCRLLEDFLS